MIEQSGRIEYNRLTALTPNRALINTDMQEVRHVKSFANTGANMAKWGENEQVIYLDSNPETLAQVEADKNKPAIVFSISEYTLSSFETLQLKEICRVNDIDYLSSMQALQGLYNVGINILKIIEI